MTCVGPVTVVQSVSVESMQSTVVSVAVDVARIVSVAVCTAVTVVEGVTVT